MGCSKAMRWDPVSKHREQRMHASFQPPGLLCLQTQSVHCRLAIQHISTGAASASQRLHLGHTWVAGHRLLASALMCSVRRMGAQVSAGTADRAMTRLVLPARAPV